MKKALFILIALAMVFGAFADDPAVNLGLKEFKGDASLTWSYDLDASKYGMKNDANASVAFTLFSKGDKVTSGDGIWGELKIESSDNADFPGITVTKKTDDDGNVTYPASSAFGASVKVAKIHFNDMIAVSILTPDLKIGEIGVASATGAAVAKTGSVDAAPANKAGFTVEITTAPVDVNVAVADNGVDTTKDYGFKVDANVKAVDGLTLKIAANYNDAFAAAAEVGYKLALGEKFSLSPAAGVYYKDSLDWVAGALFGWGAGGIDPGFKFVKKDCANGVSVAVNSAKDIVIGAFDNTFVPGLSAGADYVAKFDALGNGTAQIDAKYSTSFGDFGFAAYAGFKMNLADSSKDWKYGVSVDNKTLIDNTTLTVKYDGGKDLKGVIEASAKISF